MVRAVAVGVKLVLAALAGGASVFAVLRVVHIDSPLPAAACLFCGVKGAEDLFGGVSSYLIDQHLFKEVGIDGTVGGLPHGHSGVSFHEVRPQGPGPGWRSSLGGRGDLVSGRCASSRQDVWRT